MHGDFDFIFKSNLTLENVFDKASAGYALKTFKFSPPVMINLTPINLTAVFLHQGPPRGFFYSFNYPVSVIVAKNEAAQQASNPGYPVDNDTVSQYGKK